MYRLAYQLRHWDMPLSSLLIQLLLAVVIQVITVRVIVITSG